MRSTWWSARALGGCLRGGVLVGLAGCGGPPVAPSVWVTLGEVPTSARQLEVRASLDGQWGVPESAITERRDHLRVQLPPAARGHLRIQVVGLDPGGCGIASGEAGVAIQEPREYAAAIALAPLALSSCRLELSVIEGTIEGNIVVDPPAPRAACPARPPGAGCWTFPRGTAVRLQAKVPSGRTFSGWRVATTDPDGSDASQVDTNDCQDRGDCRLTIGRRPWRVAAQFERSRVCTVEGLYGLCWEHPYPVGVPLKMVRGPGDARYRAVWFLGDDDTLFQWEWGGQGVGAAPPVRSFDGELAPWQPEGLAVTWSGDVFVYGDRGIVLKNGGGGWWPVLNLAAPYRDRQLLGAWVRASETRAWYVGAQGLAIHQSSVWSPPPQPPRFKAVLGIGDGTTAVAAAEEGTLWRCQRESNPAKLLCAKDPQAQPAAPLNALSGSGDDLWAVGKDGATLRWSAARGTWEPRGRPSPLNLLDVLRPLGDGTLWAVAEGRGTPYRFDEEGGMAWTAAPVGLPEKALRGALRSLWGWRPRGEPLEGWAVSDEGEIIRLDPTGRWQEVSEAETREDLCAVLSRDGRDDDVWAVGKAGTVLRWDDRRWQRVTGLPTAPPAPDLLTLWGSGDERAGDDELWVGGRKGALWVRRGGAWRRGPDLPGEPADTAEIVAIHGVRDPAGARSEVWLIVNDADQRRDSRLYRARGDELAPVMLPPGDGGGGGAPGPRRLRALWGTWDGSAVDLFVVGDTPSDILLWRHRAGSWDTTYTTQWKGRFSGLSLRTVAGRSASAIWAAGGEPPTGAACARVDRASTRQLILRWSGAQWTPLDLGLGNYIALWPAPSGEVWAVLEGKNRKVVTWSEARYDTVVRNKFGFLRGLTGSDSGRLWFVGDRGAILATPR